MNPGDLVRVTRIRWPEDAPPVIGIITNKLGKFGVDTWFNVLIEGRIEAINEGEIEVLDD
jgi:hypothetical protein